MVGRAVVPDAPAAIYVLQKFWRNLADDLVAGTPSARS